VIARPDDADTATARGAAQYGLAGKTLVTTVICPRAYLMKVSFVSNSLPTSPSTSTGETSSGTGRLAEAPGLHKKQ